MNNKIFTSKGWLNINIPAGAKTNIDGEYSMPCPICSSTRKVEHRKEKVFSINLKDMNKPWRCNHCGEGGYVKDDDKTITHMKEEAKPHKLKALPEELSDKMLHWLYAKRKISVETIRKLDVKSAVVKMYQKRNKDESKIDTFQEVNALCFISYDDDVIYDVHYRDANKNFTSESGTTKIFWNLNAIKGQNKCFITEGRIDCMSMYEAGFPCEGVSVPNGVNLSVAEKQHYEKTGKFPEGVQVNLGYIDSHFQLFEGMEVIYLAVDDDIAGIKLREEMGRRFGKEKCKIIKWSKYKKANGDLCKDANDVLIHCGVEVLRDSWKDAEDFPISGIVRFNDIFDDYVDMYHNGKQKGLSIGFKLIDPHFTVMPGHSVALVAYPNVGKTSFVFNVIAYLIIKYDWTIAIYSPENYPIKNCYDTLIEILVGNTTDKSIKDRAKLEEIMMYREILQNRIVFIDNPPNHIYSHKELRNKTIELVKRFGIKMILKDPWNFIRPERLKGETLDDFLARELSNEVQMSSSLDIVNWICVHTSTPDKKSAQDEAPKLKHIHGGIMWGNKFHEIIALHRYFDPDLNKNTLTEFHSLKIKEQKLTGIPTYGKPPLIGYNRRTSRYFEEVNFEKFYPLTELTNKFKQQKEIEGF